VILALVVVGMLAGGPSHADPAMSWTPFLQQNAAYFGSESAVVVGVGPGAGVLVEWGSGFLAQADASVLWANGNAVQTRAAVGLQRQGRWAPAVYAMGALLWGQRTEVLTETGERPGTPLWAAGIHVAPLRWRLEDAFVSALELGCGIGSGGGLYLELTILAAGAGL
jgi:hypothetical protein